jgi:hypothetical protein
MHLVDISQLSIDTTKFLANLDISQLSIDTTKFLANIMQNVLKTRLIK